MKDAVAAVESSYVVREFIAKAGKSFTKGPFAKDHILQVTSMSRTEELVQQDISVSKHSGRAD